MATQEDRSLSAGVSLPKWMKNKMNNKFDLEQSSFSPTDDSFTYYYRHAASKNDTKPMTDTKVVKASAEPTVTSGLGAAGATTTAAAATAVAAAANASDKPRHVKPRPKGTDDGFKSEASQVGSKILRVANQIVSGKPLPENSPEPADECEQLLAKFDPYRRRGSRSLPASPLASPKNKRRVINRYFTSPYVESDKSKGWILSSLLAKREISQSMGFIEDEKRDELDRAASLTNVEDAQHRTTLTAKPSELREMNFWSPTSM